MCWGIEKGIDLNKNRKKHGGRTLKETETPAGWHTRTKVGSTLEICQSLSTDLLLTDSPEKVRPPSIYKKEQSPYINISACKITEIKRGTSRREGMHKCHMFVPDSEHEVQALPTWLMDFRISCAHKSYNYTAMTLHTLKAFPLQYRHGALFTNSNYTQIGAQALHTHKYLISHFPPGFVQTNLEMPPAVHERRRWRYDKHLMHNDDIHSFKCLTCQIHDKSFHSCSL